MARKQDLVVIGGGVGGLVMTPASMKSLPHSGNGWMEPQ